MPPHSKELYQEGAAIKSEKLVSEGKFNEQRITELLYKEPSQYPGCSGTRCLADNLNDLKAQIAANKKGINLINALIEEYGEEVVLFYMHQIQDNAELSVRNLLKEVSQKFSGRNLSAVDYMDDGTPIQLKVSIDADKGEAVFDFDGTGPEVYGKWPDANIGTSISADFDRQYQCPRGSHLFGDHLLSTMSDFRRHSLEPRMSEADQRPHTAEESPVTIRVCSGCRRKRAHCMSCHVLHFPNCCLESCVTKYDGTRVNESPT